MLKRADILIGTATLVLMYPCFALAAIFEMQQPVTGMAMRGTSLYPLGGSTGSLYGAMTIERRSNLQFVPRKLGTAKPEDLLWVAIGDANLVALQTLLPGPDTALYLVDTEPWLAQKTRPGNAAHPPAEGTAPEFWAVILIGAGLIWSQLRRKTRHSAIRFTAP